MLSASSVGRARLSSLRAHTYRDGGLVRAAALPYDATGRRQLLDDDVAVGVAQGGPGGAGGQARARQFGAGRQASQCLPPLPAPVVGDQRPVRVGVLGGAPGDVQRDKVGRARRQRAVCADTDAIRFQRCQQASGREGLPMISLPPCALVSRAYSRPPVSRLNTLALPRASPSRTRRPHRSMATVVILRSCQSGAPPRWVPTRTNAAGMMSGRTRTR